MSAYEVVSDVTVDGNTISEFATQSIKDCRDKCNNNLSCAGFVWDSAAEKCSLKSDVCATKNQQGSILYVKLRQWSWSMLMLLGALLIAAIYFLVRYIKKMTTKGK